MDRHTGPKVSSMIRAEWRKGARPERHDALYVVASEALDALPFISPVAMYAGHGKRPYLTLQPKAQYEAATDEHGCQSAINDIYAAALDALGRVGITVWSNLDDTRDELHWQRPAWRPSR